MGSLCSVLGTPEYSFHYVEMNIKNVLAKLPRPTTCLCDLVVALAIEYNPLWPLLTHTSSRGPRGQVRFCVIKVIKPLCLSYQKSLIVTFTK